MPRYSENRHNKIGSFLEAAGEEHVSRIPFHQGKNDKRAANDSNSNAIEATIDFAEFLRAPRYTLDDVILPQTTRQQVESILAELEHHELIYQEWGMAEKHKLDRALSINFAGPPGTGKTLTAEALAHALNSKILDVPYHLLESKYVGVTPKNIVAAFQFATEQNAVLFFDEADSFLGKRLENVTQSTDTAVNLTRSVMIKQLSSYTGVVIFATNLISNYDSAFLSRIRWKAQFDLPDKEARGKIWEVQFPAQLRLDGSVNVSELAENFDNVSGRDIKNGVLLAVVAAAKENKPKSQKCVSQHHFVDAISQVVAANKAAAKPAPVLKAVNGTIPLPENRESIASPST